jgi:hypothetical protein
MAAWTRTHCKQGDPWLLSGGFHHRTAACSFLDSSRLRAGEAVRTRSGESSGPIARYLLRFAPGRAGEPTAEGDGEARNSTPYGPGGELWSATARRREPRFERWSASS